MTNSIVSDDAAARSTFLPHIDWAAVIGGAAVAGAITAVMSAFGAAIGLSLVSPYGAPSGWGLAVAFGLWVLWITISSFAAGGYVCGRMRRRLFNSTPHESEIRDGAHGLIVWSVALLAGLFFALPSSTSSDRSAAASASPMSSMSKVSQTADPVGYNTDYLLRGERTNANVGDDTRREFTRLLSAAVTNGSLAADDRAYMTRVVATQSGLAPAEADARISTAIAQTKAATDRARKTGVLIGFLTAASLALRGRRRLVGRWSGWTSSRRQL